MAEIEEEQSGSVLNEVNGMAFFGGPIAGSMCSAISTPMTFTNTFVTDASRNDVNPMYDKVLRHKDDIISDLRRQIKSLQSQNRRMTDWSEDLLRHREQHQAEIKELKKQRDFLTQGIQVAKKIINGYETDENFGPRAKEPAADWVLTENDRGPMLGLPEAYRD